MTDPTRLDPGPGQTSVWDYPRPPRLERSDRRVQVGALGMLIADSSRAFRVLETFHPPTWYLPPEDIHRSVLQLVEGSSFCEWKGDASYFDIATPTGLVRRAAWTYIDPTPPYEALAGHVGFYPALVECIVDGEIVRPQPGHFYAGWVTDDVTGPFKGSPGMDGW